ncbi:MAG TPA: D-alanyl-D-alanine carboxypeptidase [Ruminococcus sp.]|nr:D-alanyl-D-alanine carboxypeptidase [Ruminococcus sp.]
MKRILAAAAAVLLMIPAVSTAPLTAKALNFTLKNPIQSESAMLINTDTGTVIHEKNADAKQMPGPLVNIMTAVVVLENWNDLGFEITMTDTVYSDLYETEYSQDLCFIDIENGDVLTVSDLLYAMMLTSSVEASQTLAYTVGEGDVKAFVNMMNTKAEEIGLSDTHFTNPTGMYDENQYTTARDMAKLTEYALKVPLFDTIASTFAYNPSVPNLDRHPHHDEWIWNHSNTLMDPDSSDYYPGVRGIKTANLEAAGRSIVATASKDGNNYLAVLMRSPLTDADGNPAYYHIKDAKQLFEWAFKHFSYTVVLAGTAEMGELPVSLADGHDYVLARPKKEVSMLWCDEIDISTISKDDITWYKSSLQAPVKKGEPLGTVTLKYAGEELETVELVAVTDVKRSASKYNIYAASKFPKSAWFKKAIIISSLLCAIYIIMCIYSYVLFKNKGKPVKPKLAIPKVSEKPKKNKK